MRVLREKAELRDEWYERRTRDIMTKFPPNVHPLTGKSSAVGDTDISALLETDRGPTLDQEDNEEKAETPENGKNQHSFVVCFAVIKVLLPNCGYLLTH